MNLVGQVLADRYEIIEEIGVGGMAVVYKAKCRTLNRYVAIKVLRRDLNGDADFVRRFNIEAQSAASLTHNNIVSVFDVGTHDSLHYIVMELVEGKTLKEYIDEKKELPWREAVNICMQICLGLEVAHKNAIVHRDIKPHNIMCTPYGNVKVTDFGIARANMQETMTADDTAIGSVHYISPEQARGGFVDHRTDIYSLGIVLYEMLTGRVPFDNESPVTIAIKHIQEKPVPPCQYNISIPIPLEQAVLKAISKEPSQRFKNATEFYNELSDILNDPERILNYEIEDTGKNLAENLGETRVYKTVDVSGDETVVIKNDEIKKQVGDEESVKKTAKKNNKKIDKNKEKKVIAFAIASSVIVIFGLLFAFASLMGITDILFAGNKKIEIPDVVGMQFDEAVETYTENGFNIVIGKEIVSDEESGQILEQSPESGEKVRKTDEIIITVNISSGEEEIILDSYLKYTDKRDVEIKINELGLEAEFIDEKSEEIPEGAIIRQVPRAGMSVRKGDLITFYVSSGPPEKTEETSGETNPNPQNPNTETTNPKPAKKSTVLTVFGPKNKDSANVQVKANGTVVWSKTISKGASEAVKLESTSDTVEVEILHDGISIGKQTVKLN